MMWHRGERQTGAGAGGSAGAGSTTGPAATEPAADPAAVRADAAERARAAELILAAVATEGLPALVHSLLEARSGNQDAAAMPVGALLRALPDTGWFTAHDLVSLAGITESTTVGELDAVQLSTLTRGLNRASYLPGSPQAGQGAADSRQARPQPPRGV
ncbi:hypothetical protein GXW83_30345 [Streptacidiphilus sp. PB12-B1b]|uniref:hypothetical protein n=1 Tax=Streptacidiphilus sp. PB12-B1b TaxID=2705012 RepID=UPI0015FCBE59|nr:hypothetical protein [Streptacidiphilus sp. PB12-B1b]QMU79374.1 hypothetical protein GXW83_30345 [Streptacidiphilus sp. PB12-B1b]